MSKTTVFEHTELSGVLLIQSYDTHPSTKNPIAASSGGIITNELRQRLNFKPAFVQLNEIAFKFFR